MLDELLKEARGWLADCGWKSIASDRAIIAMVNCHYVGGWTEFVSADNTIDSALVYLLVSNRFGLDFTNRLYWQNV